MSRLLRSAWLACIALGALACNPVDGLQLLAPGVGSGSTLVRVVLGAGYVEGSLEFSLDAAPLALQSETRTAWGVRAIIATPAGGAHTLVAEALFDGAGGTSPRQDEVDFSVPDAAPALLSSTPADGVLAARTSWIDLHFAAAVPEAARDGFELLCGGGGTALAARAFALHAVEPQRLVLNPHEELPPGAQCVLHWWGQGGAERLDFAVAPDGPAASVAYDRSDPEAMDPFPDDFWLVDDPGTATGSRVAMEPPPQPESARGLFDILQSDANILDGWSPIAHWVIALSDAPDPESLPTTPGESLDPLASVALLDIDPDSPGFGERIPFRLEIRDDTSAGGQQHVLLLFPSIPLEPQGQVGLVITRRALSDPGRPFGPSAFFDAALNLPAPGEPPEVSAVRSLSETVLSVAETAMPPIPREDVALALRATVRSIDDVPNDLRAVKDQILAADPPAVQVTACRPPNYNSESDNAKVAAIIEGTFSAPDWRDGGVNFVHDEDGDLIRYPAEVPSRDVDFILVLPAEAAGGTPVPLTMYQHGNPGSAQREVPFEARDYLAEAGFGVIGFTDILNRELSPGQTGDDAIMAQVFAIFFSLLQNRSLPDAWSQTNAEQIAFLRALENLNDALPDVPFDECDDVYAVDLQTPLTYVGISQGSNHAPALLPYAPEITAAALVVGGSRLAEVLIHQQASLFIDPTGPIGLLFPSLTPAQIWAGLGLFQTIHDIQDAHVHGRFWYREPFDVAGDSSKASVLVIEGIDDSLVPNHATDSLAHQLGVPFLRPVQRDVPFLPKVTGPVAGNLAAGETGAYYQYVPIGIPGIDPTPGCVPPAVPQTTAQEGHFCAQSAAESELQRTVFFQTAIGGDPAPTIIDPLAE